MARGMEETWTFKFLLDQSTGYETLGCLFAWPSTQLSSIVRQSAPGLRQMISWHFSCVVQAEQSIIKVNKRFTIQFIVYRD